MTRSSKCAEATRLCRSRNTASGSCKSEKSRNPERGREKGGNLPPDDGKPTRNKARKGKQTMAHYTINHNAAFDSEEITFNGIPAAPIREALKAAGFRWHSVKKVWYGKKTPEEITAIITAADGQTESGENRLVKADAPQPKKEKAAEAPKGTPQDKIRIYYNGIKVNGGKLIKCGYSIGDHCVTIYARDYEDLPRDIFPDIKNDTDLYTDYFDNDSCTITPAHPLYKYVYYSALKDAARNIKRWGAGYGESAEKRAAATLAEFEKTADPGQPTAEDLAKIDQQNTARENARKAAEQAADQKRRERALNNRCDGWRIIDAATKAHPLTEDAPAVVIEWSEHPAISDGLRLSVPAAEIILKTLDDKQHADREIDPDTAPTWYYKTKFVVEFIDPEDGEPGSYTGRYDLGDGDGGLLAHIRGYSDSYGYPERNKFVDWLASFCGQEEKAEAV